MEHSATYLPTCTIRYRCTFAPILQKIPQQILFPFLSSQTFPFPSVVVSDQLVGSPNIDIPGNDYSMTGGMYTFITPTSIYKYFLHHYHYSYIIIVTALLQTRTSRQHSLIPVKFDTIEPHSPSMGLLRTQTLSSKILVTSV